MPSQVHESLIPSTSPLLAPSHPSHHHHHSSRNRNSADSFTLQSNYRNPDIPNDLEFLAPGQWDDDDHHHDLDLDHDDDDDDASDSQDDDDFDQLDEDADVEDWTLEDGHVEGVARSNLRLDAKQYKQDDFLALLLPLFRDQLRIPGWVSLPPDTPPSLIQIHKISGALTNAVFFVSVPETECDVEVAVTVESPGVFPAGPRVLTPLTVLGELERGRQAAQTPVPRHDPRDDTPSSPHSEPSTPVVETSSLPGYLPTEDDTPPDSHANSPLSTEAPPTPTEPRTRTERVVLSAPTLLLRIYGPSSGSLISRRNELHILHTLSSQYGIGPHVLGTFANGRVEEYFHSRALDKDEMRDARLSRWISRRMRELHSVELDRMVPPWSEQDEEREREQRAARRARSRSPSGAPVPHDERPGPKPLSSASGNKSPVSGASVYSTSSSSSVFSFGTTSSSSSVRSFSSSYSTSSLASVSTLNSFGTPRSLVSSPALLPHRQASESRADDKKRSRRRGTGSSSSRRRTKKQHKLCVWENITRWTREAKNVLRELDELAQLPGLARLVSTPSAASSPTGPLSHDGASTSSSTSAEHVPPLASVTRTFAIRAALNLPQFEQELRLYRAFVHAQERASGHSKRVFAHNDTQYGNLLLMTPTSGGREAEDELERKARREGGAHKRLIVVDFEYAGANPRAFDIANHFCEWQADYHHPSLSHSLSAHQTYPTQSERARFLRAYIGSDGGFDGPASGEGSAASGGGRDDARVERLEEEVRVWQPSSHAQWAVWGIVQAKEDLLARIKSWKDKAARGSRATSSAPSPLPSPSPSPSALVDQVKELGLDDADELVDLDDMEEVGEVFDYLSYAAERMNMFRSELRELGVVSS
ncbi:uncharacterized protein RHOBADRAFT_51902 [Rhodotorula graminis WP1]|uniref:Choline kinase N-terminal domain-containing protein n=1 Tax=Rhodotorula graminis (strain WP1) TaxID=578459 RepID=A0A194S8X3_RHOGW|nr:uncharacterized protein RHOBADRAFT_51902 [Rhodotorula graminis WP1]KPV76920.1 hypothetical protein RHOBADRAFT_51902 [Rhodotorula graminis WP1]